MILRARAALAALLLLSCRDRRRDLTRAPDARVVAADAPAPQEPPPRPAPAWCWRAMHPVDVRAIDARGAVWAIEGRYLLDETRGVASDMPQELPCPRPARWALAFDADDRGYAVAAGRFYVRAGRSEPFRVTPLCTDVGGAPWSLMRNGGYGLVNAPPRGGRAMLLTNDRTGAMGWFAVTAMEDSLTHAVLAGDRSVATLSAGGHLVVVDQTRIVAGEVLATRSELFAGLSRTPSGILAWRDASPTDRVLVMSDSLNGEFTRVESSHPAARTLGVFRLDLARLVAVTDQGIELSTDNGVRFSRVLPRAIDARAGERAGAGWLPGRHPAVALPDGVATDDCDLRDGGGAPR